MRTAFSIQQLANEAHDPGLIVGLALLVPLVALFAGCEEDDPVAINTPPSAPDGVFSVTGDGQVTICWNPNPENDIAGYDVYWNDQPTGYYEYVATVGPSENCYVDTDVDNGTTYFYAVLAFDKEGLESDLSYETIFDTPRPEGFDVILYDYLGQNTSLSGYDFWNDQLPVPQGVRQAFDASTTDVYFGAPSGVFTIFAARAEVDIQDYGYIDLIDVDWAPDKGWSLAKQVEAIVGHCYVIRIDDGQTSFNVAKIYVKSVTPDAVTVDWAYQIDPGNLELSPGKGGVQ